MRGQVDASALARLKQRTQLHARLFVIWMCILCAGGWLLLEEEMKLVFALIPIVRMRLQGD